MQFAEIDFASFLETLKTMKKEIELDLKENPELDDESKVLLDSINVLIKELKGVSNYERLSLEKKTIVLPHLALVFLFTSSIHGDDEDFFDDEELEMDEWEESDEEEEMEEEEEEVQRPLPIKSSHQCCGGHDHHHKPPKGKK